jgi:methyl-accepting chemotaxis protein
MDKVTQQVASNAEESASASEELSAQSQQLMSVVGDLISLVGGSQGNNGASHGRLSLGVSSTPKAVIRSGKPLGQLSHHQGSAKAADTIPFDDDSEISKDF